MRVALVAGLLVVTLGCAVRARLSVPLVCPDAAPPKVLQHPACGVRCGYSCLPDRWKEPAK